MEGEAGMNPIPLAIGGMTQLIIGSILQDSGVISSGIVLIWIFAAVIWKITIGRKP
jgi:hypothetical protein